MSVRERERWVFLDYYARFGPWTMTPQEWYEHSQLAQKAER